MKWNPKLWEGFREITCVFLDRDGVINVKAAEGEYIRDWSTFELLPGVESAIAALNRSGRRVIVVSNQRGISQGLYSAADVEALHKQLQEHLAHHGARLDALYFCPHDKEQCTCRKPGIGLLEKATRDFSEISPTTSVMVGDSLSDVEAARRWGCRSIFVEGDSSTQKAGASEAADLADVVVGSLAEAVCELLRCAR